MKSLHALESVLLVFTVLEAQRLIVQQVPKVKDVVKVLTVLKVHLLKFYAQQEPIILTKAKRSA